MEAKLVSAGELRGLGFEVHADIPDCATVPLSAIHYSADVSTDTSKENGTISLGMSLSFDEPFSWISIDIKCKTALFFRAMAILRYGSRNRKVAMKRAFAQGKDIEDTWVLYKEISAELRPLFKQLRSRR